MSQFFKFLFASCLGTILAFGALFFLAWGIGAAVISSTENKIVVKENSVLKLDFPDPIPEHTNNVPVSSISLEQEKTLGLHNIIKTIAHAKEDDNIKGIYLNPTFIGASQAGIRSLRMALQDFKESGKFIVSHATGYSQKSYLLVSPSDYISVHPFGMVDFRGLSTMIPFFPEVMEKLGVKANIYYAGQFKSATEPFRLTKMSPQNKLQTREYLNEMYDIYLEQISESRPPSKAELKEIANEFKARTAEDALAFKMIDGINYEEDVINIIKEKIGLKEEKELKLLDFKDYEKVARNKTDYKVKDKIAIVFAEGNIVDGEGEEGSIGGKKYSKLLRKIRKNKSIKAVVLRINSGGGSVLASEDILHEVKALKAAGKPVVASYGDVSASGGYYISCAADKILCEPNTITGSIGVFMMAPNFTEMIQENIGVKFDTVNTGKYSSSFSLVYNWGEKEGKFLQSETDAYYDLFLNHVAEGRKMSKDDVHKVAQGRVWSGRKALELGLVDELGGLERALEITAELAGLEKYRTTNYPVIKDPLIRMIEDLTGQKTVKITDQLIKAQLGEVYPYFEMMKELKNCKGPQARVPFLINNF